MRSRGREITRDYAGTWEEQQLGCYHLRSKGQFFCLKRSSDFPSRVRARMTRCPEARTKGIKILISLLPPFCLLPGFPVTKSKLRLEAQSP